MNAWQHFKSIHIIQINKIPSITYWPILMKSKSGSFPKQSNHIPQCCWAEEGGQKAFKVGKESKNAQIPYTVKLGEKGRDRWGGCRLLRASTPSQLLVRPPHRTLEGNIAQPYWQTIRTVFLTLSTCSRFSSLPWSWFLSNRAKSLSCVTAPRVSLRLTYSDFTHKNKKREEIDLNSIRAWSWHYLSNFFSLRVNVANEGNGGSPFWVAVGTRL